MAAATGIRIEGVQNEATVSARHRLPATGVGSAKGAARGDRTASRTDYLTALAPATCALVGGGDGVGGRRVGARRAGNPRGLRRDPARLVVAGKGVSSSRRGTGRVDTGRRTRLRHGTPRVLAAWLHRTARVHAHLCAIVRLYGSPERAGGQSNQGDTYAARAAAGDRTLLYDCLTVSRDELDAIRAEVEAAMDAAAPVAAPPGTADKVEEMARRAERGESLFIRGDGARSDEGSSGG